MASRICRAESETLVLGACVKASIVVAAGAGAASLLVFERGVVPTS